jgi:hypothetical protein
VQLTPRGAATGLEFSSSSNSAGRIGRVTWQEEKRKDRTGKKGTNGKSRFGGRKEIRLEMNTY